MRVAVFVVNVKTWTHVMYGMYIMLKLDFRLTLRDHYSPKM